MNINELYISTIENGGNTIQNNLTTPKKGYMVAVNNIQPKLIPNKGLTRFQFKKILKKVTKTTNKNLCAGFWLNPEDNMWYIEPSEKINNKREALKIGKDRKQISIFNLSNFETINC